MRSLHAPSRAPTAAHDDLFGFCRLLASKGATTGQAEGLKRPCTHQEAVETRRASRLWPATSVFPKGGNANNRGRHRSCFPLITFVSSGFPAQSNFGKAETWEKRKSSTSQKQTDHQFQMVLSQQYSRTPWGLSSSSSFSSFVVSVLLFFVVVVLFCFVLLSVI